jgi:hypothetical protein
MGREYHSTKYQLYLPKTRNNQKKKLTDIRKEVNQNEKLLEKNCQKLLTKEEFI